MKKTDWAAKAQSARRNLGGRECSICKQPEVAAGILVMCTERAEGRSDIAYTGMAEIVLKELGVRIKPNTLRNHVAVCLPEIHRKIQAHERHKR